MDEQVVEIVEQPEGQEQPERLERPVEVVTVEDAATLMGDSLSVSRDAEDAAISDLTAKVSALGDSVRLLADSGSGAESGEDAVYLVRLDASQVETAKSGLRVACTEGLVLVILLGISCGLQFWQAFSGRWGNG